MIKIDLNTFKLTVGHESIEVKKIDQSDSYGTKNRKALKKQLLKFKNPYYKKNTGQRITKIIENIKIDNKILKKKLIFDTKNGF